MDLPDYLPLSYLNQLLYCERRFWYMYVLGELAVNAALLEGTLRHEHADQPGTERIEEGRVIRRLAVYSDRLRINGFCDLVEEAGGVLRPVEYKRGKQGRWDNDQVQLCAQALCLEEQHGAAGTDGRNLLLPLAPSDRGAIHAGAARRDHCGRRTGLRPAGGWRPAAAHPSACPLWRVQPGADLSSARDAAVVGGRGRQGNE